MTTRKINIESLINRMQCQLQEAEQIPNRIRPFFPESVLPYDTFIKMLSLQGSIILNQQGQRRQFVPQEHHQFIISNMYKWLVGDDTFEVKQGIPGDLQKGIILYGKIGCGKTTLMRAFLNTLEILAEGLRIVIKHITPEEFTDLAKNGRFDDYTKGMLNIDDICREAATVKEFGNVVKPMVALIGRRYYSSHLTFGTTNFLPAAINRYYGSYITDRLFSLCNYMKLEGESMRPVQSNIQLKLDIENE